MRTEDLRQLQLCGVSFVLISLVLGPQNFQIENIHKSVIVIARYVVYFILLKAIQRGCELAYESYNTRTAPDWRSIWTKTKKTWILWTICASLLLYKKEPVLAEDFPLLCIAYLICQYQEMEQGAPMINYGVGMACSFFEGYLTHVIPSDGARFVGFQENINIFEASQGVVFPVKRLFIVITKSLYCPPDLKHFNKENRHDLAFLEAVKSLEDIEKDVAGVKNRTYRNSAYKIYRPGPTRKPPVFVCAEFATPLHTLHKVLEKRFIYDKLCDVDAEVIVKDFCDQLRKIIARSPDCRRKCELVHYDDTNPDENLADVLLNKIKEIEPEFDEIIEKKSREIK